MENILPNSWTGVDKYYKDSSLKDIYNTLLSEDLSDCVVLARNVLKETNNWMEFLFKEKSISISESFLIWGSTLLRNNIELKWYSYNYALMYAPNNSAAMQSAYIRRVELSFLIEGLSITSFINDINKCLALNCPQNVVEHLTKMKSTASKLERKEKIALAKIFSPYAKNFFKLEDSNPDVPCATSHVDVVVESGQVKVVAARNITVGTLLANETAFMVATNPKNEHFSCHYCLRIAPDLKPCDECCKVLFCDENCKEKSKLEGHDVECKIVDIIVDDIKLPFKAMLKIRSLCNSWDEFIAVSNDLSTDGMRNEITGKIFGFNKFSVLKPRDDKSFTHGKMFNKCMCIVNIIHYLETRTSFFPECPEEREAAIRAVARVFLHLSLYCTPVRMLHAVRYILQKKMQLHDHTNRGYFPLIGNLAHSCTPNTLVIGLRNSAALIAIKPIKKGEQLTLSYIGYLETEKYGTERVTKLLDCFGITCKDCVFCENNIPRNQSLNAKQLKAFRNMPRTVECEKNTKNLYEEVCRVMCMLSSVPFSKEYFEAYVEFHRYVIFFVLVNYRNEHLSTLKFC